MELPKCCQNCQHIAQEARDYLPDVHSCWLHVLIPFKKETCKRQKPPNKEIATDARGFHHELYMSGIASEY